MSEALLAEPAVKTRLEAGLQALNLADDKLLAKLLCYLQLLGKWNRVHNLTAVRDPLAQVSVHLLDCLAVHRYLPDSRDPIVDVGSGAGLPGLMLALCRPGQSVYLIESNGKKCAFLREAVRVLDLPEVVVISGRVESWQPEFLASVVISRALAEIDLFLELTAHLGGEKTRWMLMKAQENEGLTLAGFAVASVQAVDVPFLDGERRLITIKRTESVR